MPPFRFLTNHGLALLCIADDPTIRIREIGSAIGITERAAQRIVSDLTDAGYVIRVREGRRNSYSVRLDLPIMLPNQRDVDLHSLLEVLLPLGSSERRRGGMEHGRSGPALAPAGSPPHADADGS
jgi:DNA-binding transcriptional ArsR family regulator